MTDCDRCRELTGAAEAANAKCRELEQQVAELEVERAELQGQLAELTKLCELQQADLERYRQAVEASRPNHPERAPREQLQLAFARVLESLGAQPPANDEQGPDDDGAHTAEDGSGQGAAGNGRGSQPKRRHPHGRRRLDTSSLPVIAQRIEPDEVKATGGEGFVLIGEEVSDRIALRPAEWVVYRVIRPKYVAAEALAQSAGGAAVGQELESDGGSRITIASLPAGVWPNVMADPSAIANVIMSKYGDLLPLNRQQDINARRGFELPKSTQCGWLKAANAFCAPVVDGMFDDSRRNAFVIATDATGAPVLPGRRSEQECGEATWPGEPRRCVPWHVFVFIADRAHVVFRHAREHTGAAFEKLLAGYHGNILADAASVFDVLYRDHGMTEHACWFHCRRPFYRALETDPPRALEALSLIGKLFEIDREVRARNLDLEAFTRLRAQQATPILKLFDDWIELNRERVDPRSPLDKAIGYYTNQRDALHRFLQDGRISLHNNSCEQALRNLVAGLDNWRFFANETGLIWYTTFRSLIASCLLHRLNPEVYLEQLLRIVPHWPKNRVLELAPKNWLATVANLDPKWRSMLARPWEPDVIVSAQVEPSHPLSVSATERAA
jgi:transposase